MEGWRGVFQRRIAQLADVKKATIAKVERGIKACFDFSETKLSSSIAQPRAEIAPDGQTKS